jgi:hypothetical protein
LPKAAVSSRRASSTPEGTQPMVFQLRAGGGAQLFPICIEQHVREAHHA